MCGAVPWCLAVARGQGVCLDAWLVEDQVERFNCKSWSIAFIMTVVLTHGKEGKEAANARLPAPMATCSAARPYASRLSLRRCATSFARVSEDLGGLRLPRTSCSRSRLLRRQASRTSSRGVASCCAGVNKRALRVRTRDCRGTDLVRHCWASESGALEGRIEGTIWELGERFVSTKLFESLE